MRVMRSLRTTTRKLCPKQGDERTGVVPVAPENRFPGRHAASPFVYGPGNPFYRRRSSGTGYAKKRPIIIPGDGRRLMQFVYVKDLVWACLRAMEEPGAAGHAFNIANFRPVTQTEAVEALAAVASKKAQTVRVPARGSCELQCSPTGSGCTSANTLTCPPLRRW